MELEITGLNDQGKGISYVNNKIIFIDGGIPGDVLSVNITKETTKYQEGKIIKIIKSSPLRVKSFCKYSSICGGCHLSNMDYQETISFKEKKLSNIMKKFAGIEKEIIVIPAKEMFHYRNKITLKVSHGIVGYFQNGTNDIVEIKECLIASSTINDFIKVIPDFEVKNGSVVIRSNYNNELLVNFITDDPIVVPDLKDLKMVGILKSGKILKGTDKFMQRIDNKFFQVSYDSFFQINDYINTCLFKTLNEYILPNSVVLDLYSGVGTLGLSVSKKVKKVYGVEIIQNAVINAITNAKMNGAENVKYLLGDVSNNINKIQDNIDSVIVDPPRSGLDKFSLNYLIKIRPKQIIYIACDPITLARDLKELKSAYDIVSINGLDMFPFTYHCETIAILRLKDK